MSKYIIYKVTCLINNKIYVGQTSKSLKIRKNNHIKSVNLKSNNYFHKALRKHGLKNFKWEIIYKCNTRNKVNEKETEFIKHYKSFGKYGYNQCVGGNGTNGYKLTEAQKQKISLSVKSTMNSPKIKEKCRVNGKKVHLNPITRKKFLINNKLAQNTKKAKESNSKAQRGIWKVWNIVTKEEFIINNLKQFCKERNLKYYCMKFINRNKQFQHKNWRCKLIRRYNKCLVS